MNVGVVGGGIAGLSAAWALADHAEVTVYEPSHLGGALRTSEIGGRLVEEGPDAFIVRTPEALALCAELGMDGELIAPQAGKTFLVWKGEPTPLPEGLIMGAPRKLSSLAALAASPLMEPLDVLRAALDLILPPLSVERDMSVRELVASRLGPAVADNLVGPLIGSIHAGDPAKLSATATAPQLIGALKRSRSLLLGLRSLASNTPARPHAPMFMAPKGGMQSLVERLVARLTAKGVRFVDNKVSALTPTNSSVVFEGVWDEHDAAIVATSAAACSTLLGSTCPSEIRRIQASSVSLVTLVISSKELETPPGYNGLLVPASEGMLMTACSFGSSKWPHWASPGRTVLRISCGRSNDERQLRLSDEALVETLSEETGKVLGARFTPIEWRVSRWPGMFAQYEVGHLERIDAAEAELSRTTSGRIALAGSNYRGAGIPACIASGRRAAQSLLQKAP